MRSRRQPSCLSALFRQTLLYFKTVSDFLQWVAEEFLYQDSLSADGEKVFIAYIDTQAAAKVFRAGAPGPSVIASHCRGVRPVRHSVIGP